MQRAPFERLLTDEQYEAIYEAKFAKGLTYREIHEQATTGKLNGEAFQVSADYIGDLCRREKKRRLGKNPTPVAEMTAQDSNAHMRRRLLSLFESEALILERQRPGKRDLPRLEQLAKAGIVIARIPGPKDPAPGNPSSRDANGQRVTELRGGTTGALIKALRTGAAGQPDIDDSDAGQEQA